MKNFVLPLLVALAANGAALAPARAQDHRVMIENFAFKPATVNLKPGDTVTWVNGDDIPHLVVDTQGKFRSKALDTGDSFTFALKDAGAFSYFCGLHPMMTGKLVVAP